MRMQAKEEEKGEIELFYIKMKEKQDRAKKVFTMTPLIVALDKLGIMIQAGQAFYSNDDMDKIQYIKNFTFAVLRFYKKFWNVNAISFRDGKTALHRIVFDYLLR